MNFQTKPKNVNLKSLISNLKVQTRNLSDSLEITGISHDSRNIEPGFLYAALPGKNSHGIDFAMQALKNGAVAILSDKPPKEDTPTIISTSLRRDLGAVAHSFYGNPSKQMKIIGITGTNGKTTNVFALKTLLQELGEKVGIFSTLGVWVDQNHLPTNLGLPESPEVAKYMNLMQEAGCSFCLLEATSMGVFQERLSGVTFDGGIFTNLTHDHLDDHGSFENYLEAKRSFLRIIPEKKPLVVNSDDSNWKEITKDCVADILTFGANNESADFTFETLDQNNNFQEIRITKKATNDIFTLKSSLVGDYNAQNIVGITVLLLQIFGTEKTTRLIQGDAFLRLSTPGRLQNIPNTLGLQIFVDYAHTPDALENVLKTLQKLKPANASLICVFGCGGDRDITKRPLMGEISSRIADVTIITSDNPRTENPEVIIAQIKTGTAGASSLVRDTLERASAISQSIATAKPGDIILIAGKGHEAYQEIDGVRHPFSDVYVVQEFLTQVGLQDKV